MMLHSIFKQAGLKAFALTAFLVTFFALSARAGLDSYAIYLNNKLVLKQSVSEPLNLAGLHLDQANVNDKLVIYYSECHAPNKLGTGRSIQVKNEEGETIKEWRFADVSGKDKGMEIPVKELLALKKRIKGNLSLVYTATLLPKGQMLTGVQFG